MDKCIKLYKCGKFYNGYGDNSKILSKIMRYKFRESSNSSGFLDIALNKVRGILELKKISYVIYDKDNILYKYKGIDKYFDKEAS